MRRKPLRPLAHVIASRLQGENPNLIEADERCNRNQAIQVKTRVRAETRLMLLGIAFILGFCAIGGKMAMLASSSPHGVSKHRVGSEIMNQRAKIFPLRSIILAR